MPPVLHEVLPIILKEEKVAQDVYCIGICNLPLSPGQSFILGLDIANNIRSALISIISIKGHDAFKDMVLGKVLLARAA